MKGLIFLCFLIAAFVNVKAQSVRFVNYGSNASVSEGDDNFVQVINFTIPADTDGSVYLRLFDMSCGSQYDLQFGNWDSRFRFSLYKNEYTEERFLRNSTERASFKNDLIYHYEIGQDQRYYNSWYTLANLKRFAGEAATFSLVVEGVSGNDANNFDLFFSSDSLTNNNVANVILYSYEPTLAFKRSDQKSSFKFYPSKEEDEITIHLFDMDGTKTFFSSLLQDETELNNNNPSGWFKTRISIEEIERLNACAIDIAAESKPANDLTFRVTGKDGKKFVIYLPAYKKEESTIPRISKLNRFLDCNTYELDFSASNSQAGGELKYYWFFDDGFVSNDSLIIRSFEQPGKYNGKVIIEESGSAVTRARLERVQIIINKQPTAAIDGNFIGEPNKQINLSGSRSFDDDGKIIKYSWDFGDGSSAEGKSISHIYSNPGIYTVKLTVQDDFEYSCNEGIDSAIVVINAQPLISTETTVKGSPNQLMKFDASQSADLDGGIIKYIWNFGTGIIKEGAVVEHAFEKPGIYSIELTAEDDSEAPNSKSTASIKVIINSAPKANAGNDKTTKISQSVMFDAGKSIDVDGEIIEYFWEFGDGNSASGKTTQHQYENPGIYSVKLKVKDNSEMINDSSIDSLLVAVNETLSKKVGNTIYSNSGVISFDASRNFELPSVSSTYNWKFGDGGTGLGKIVEYNYGAPGKYNVVLTTEDRIETERKLILDSLVVFINRRPISDPGSDHTIAPGTKILFNSANSIDPDGKIVSTRWLIENETVSEENIFEYSFTKSGIYNVGLEVTDDFIRPLSDIKYSKIIVNESPIAKIETISLAAPNQKIKLDASKSYDIDGKIIEYNWSFSDNTSTRGVTVEKEFKSPGIYTATLSVKDNSNVENSVSKKTVQIKINSEPVIKIKELVETCGNIVTLDASGSTDPDGDPLKFTWSLSKGEIINGSSVITHHFQERGLVPVTLSINDGNGLNNSEVQKTIIVNLHEPPVADAGSDTTVCAGDIVIFSGLKSKAARDYNLEYEWTFEDSTKLFGSSIFKVFKEGGLYTVFLKVRDNSGLSCDSAIDYKVIKVIETPRANAGEDFEACANRPVKFDGSKSIDIDGIVNSYDWDFGDGETGGGEKPEHIYSKPGKYKVTLTISGDQVGGCDNTDKDELIVTINEAPVAIFNAVESAAVKEEIVCDASSSSVSSGAISKYLWSFGDSTFAEGKIVKHQYNAYGKFEIELKVITDSKTQCNTNSYSRLITINESPKAVAEGTKNAAVNQIIQFSGIKSFDLDGRITKYFWDLGDGTSKEGIKINHLYKSAGNYKVVLRVEDDQSTKNNSALDSFNIVVNGAPTASFDIIEKSYKGENVELNASKSFDTDGRISRYEWYVNEVKVSEEKITSHKFENLGKNRIKLVVTDNADQQNSSAELTRYIEVFNYPEITLPESLMVCPDEVFTLTPTVNSGFEDSSLKYKWKVNSEVVLENSKIFSGNISKPGKNMAALEILNNKNIVVSSLNIGIIVNTPPTINAINDTIVNIDSSNDELLLKATVVDADTGPLVYLWELSDGTKYDKPRVFHKFKKEGKYKVTLTVDDQMKTKCSKSVQSFYVEARKQKK